MPTIYELCPSLMTMTLTEELNAVVRMCIAHVMNGGEYKGLYVTAREYLESLI